MKEKTIKGSEVPGVSDGDKEKDFVIRKLNYGDMSLLQDELVNINVDKGHSGGSIKIGQLRLYTLALGVKEAPFFGDNVNWAEGLSSNHLKSRLHIIRNLDEETGSHLYQEVLRMNPGLLGSGGGVDKKK